MRSIAFIGYSGHAYVCIDSAISNNYSIAGYFEKAVQKKNPYMIPFLGSEKDKQSTEKILAESSIFIAIGNNTVRENIALFLEQTFGKQAMSLIHSSSIISDQADISTVGCLVSAGAVINPLVTIEDYAIINSGAIVEHECLIEKYAHIAPGAVLAGNVKVGRGSFIGANSVVIQGVTIGNDVTVGAGSVILKDIPDGATVVGNPGKIIKTK